MKKFKFKFYLLLAIIYLFLAFIAFLLSYCLLEQNMKSFFIKYFSANKVGSEDIVEFVIDDASTTKYPWPWSRILYTELLSYFTEYAKPKLIGLDIIMENINSDDKADADFVNYVSKMNNLVSGFNTVNILDESFMNECKKKYSLNMDDSAYPIKDQYSYIKQIQKPYLDASKHLASVNVNYDENSKLLLLFPNIVKLYDSYYPSMALKMYMVENNTNDLKIDHKNIIVPKTGLRIPHNGIRNGMLSTDINFYDNLIYKYDNRYIKSSYTHKSFSAYKIIETYRNLKYGTDIEKEDYIDPAYFNGKTVFIGANLSGPSADVHPTPMELRHAGVDVQATVYDNIVHNEFLHNAGWYIQLLTIVILAILTFISVLKLLVIKSLLLVTLLDFLFFIAVAVCAYNNYIISFINPIAVQLVTLVFGFAVKFIYENFSKEIIRQAMGKYLSEGIMQNVINNIEDLKLGGKRTVVTVLFSDIRGFTTMSEKLTPDAISMILNEYFKYIEPIITKYNGVINKFIGDAVMVIFGEPIADTNHAKNAVKCAYEILKTVENLREKWLYEGKPKIEIGIGINTGEVFIGNVGTETRMEYTVIGDTVNLASRIESYNKVYKTNLLVSSSTYFCIADIADVIKINDVQIRGKAKKMDLYEVLRIER